MMSKPKACSPTKKASFAFLQPVVFYLLAIGLPFLVLALRMYLPVSSDQHRMLVLFVPTLLIFALFGGLGPTLVATATTALIVTFFLLPPHGQLHIDSSADLLQWSMLVLSGILAALIGLIQRRLRQQANQGREQAECLLQAEKTLNNRLRMTELGGRVGVWEFDPITTSLWMTPECEALYGVPPGTLTDFKRWQACIHPDDLMMVDAQLDKAMEGEDIDAEFRVLWPDGNVRWLYARGRAERDASGAIVRLSGIDHDITVRKQTELELAQESQKNRLFLQCASDGIHILDAQGYLIQASNAFCDMLGYTREEISNMHVSAWDAHFNETELKAKIEQLLDQPQRISFETRHRRKDGSIFDVEISAVSNEVAGQKTLFTSSRDITERKLAEEALRSREAMLSESQRLARVGSWRWDLAGPIEWTAETYHIYGVEPESFIPTVDSLIELVHPEDRPKLMTWIVDCAAGKPADAFEFRAVQPDGTLRHLRGQGELICQADGKVLHMIGTVQDITERVKLETAIKDSEREFRLLAEAMPQIVWATRPDGWNTYFNHQWVEYTGLSLEESYGHGWNKPFHPEDQQRAWDAWRNAVEHNAEYALECRLRRFDGDYRWWLIRGVPVLGDDGTIQKWFGTCTDIQDIKLREAEIKASEQRRQFALEILHAGEWELNLNTRKAIRSRQHDQIFGYDAMLPDWTYEMFLQHVVLEDRERVDCNFRQALQERSNWNFECRIRRVDGETRWIQASGAHCVDTFGEPTLVGIVIDITDQKLAAAELERSRLLLEEGERIAGLGVWEYEVASQKTFWSAEEMRIYGYEAVGLSPVYQDMLRDCIHPDDAQELNRLFQEALAHATPFEMEHKIVRPDGTIRHVQDLGYPYFDAAGSLIKYIGTTIDITERKLVMDALVNREQHLNLALEAAQAGSWEWHIENNQVYWSDHLWKLYGLLPDQCQPSYEAWEQSIHPEDREIVSKSIAQAVERDEEYEIQWRVNVPPGVTERWLMARGRPINKTDGKGKRYIGIVIDISESKRAAAEIKLWADAFQHCAHGIAIGDSPNNIIRSCNPSFADTLGLRPEDIAGMPIPEIYVPSERAKLQEVIAHADSQGQVSFESQMRHQNGSVLDVQMDVVSVRDDQGVPLYRVATMQDISARKKAENALRDSEQRLTLFIEHAPAALAMFDRDMRYLAASRRWLTDYGLEDSNIIGHLHYDIFPDIPERWKELHRRGLAGEVVRAEEDAFERIDGRLQWLRWEIRPWITSDGHVGGIVIISEDITERKLAQTELSASMQRFHDIAEVSADWIWEVDANVCYTFVSAGVELFLGYKPKELLGKTPFDLMPADEAIRVREMFSGIVAQGLPFRDLENLNVHKNGHLLHVLTNGVPIKDQQGQLIGYRGVDKDITEYKHQVELLRASETRLRAILEGAQDGILMADIQSKRLLGANPAICAMLGYRPEELSEMTVADIHREADLPRILKVFEGMATGEIKVGEDLPVLHRDGSVFSADISASRMEIDGVQYLAGFFRDITLRKQTEHELEAYRLHLEELVAERTAELERLAVELGESEARHRYAMDASSDGLWDWRIQTNESYCNPAYFQMLGYEPDELSPDTAGHLINLLHPDDRETTLELIQRLIKSPGHYAIEFRLRAKDGSYHHILSRGRVVEWDAEGNPRRAVGTHSDISEQKAAESTLREAKTAAEAATLAKSTFLANMSHEIRTPMNAVLGFCHILKQRALDRESQNLVGKIHRSGQSLLDIINDILDFSKIESGKLEIESAPFSLFDLLEDLGSVIGTATDQKNLELVLVPMIQVNNLVGDKTRLRQILINLLGNAIKFTAQGQVILRIDENTGKENQVDLRFSVTDTGIGINPEQQKLIFAPFSQADLSISRRFGGSGLGLSISKYLVELMGGELQLSSELGRGSEFFFTLPFLRNNKETGSSLDLFSRHLLAASNCSATREGIIATAKCLGWDAEVLDSSEAVLARLGEAPTLYDAVLLDGEMLGLDGLTNSEAVNKAFEGRNHGVPQPPIVVMIKAQASSAIESQLRTNMVDTWLSKPLTPLSLYKAVDRVLNRPRIEVSTSQKVDPYQPTSKRLSGVRILVVDDSEINREVAITILAEEGAVLHSANDGREAVDWLQANEDNVDIVLMDIQMPNLDGYAATRLIRKDPRFKQLPIVALSAGVFRSLQNAAKDAGMDDFVAKPFDVDQLITVVLHWVNPQSPDVQPRKADSAASGHADSQAPTNVAQSKSLPDLDWTGGLKRWADAAGYRKYLNKFIESYADSAEVMAKHCAQGDLSAAAALAHKLKGVAGTLSLPRVAEIVGQLENLLRANQPASAGQISELQTAIDAACSTIEKLSGATGPLTADSQPAPQTHLNQEVAQLLDELVSALDEYDLNAAELALGSLEQCLGEYTLTGIKDRIADFDYSGAKALVKTMLLDLGNSSME